jgi:hypothetical protein
LGIVRFFFVPAVTARAGADSNLDGLSTEHLTIRMFEGEDDLDWTPGQPADA